MAETAPGICQEGIDLATLHGRIQPVHTFGGSEIGLVFLIIASVWRMVVVNFSAHPPSDLMDATTGVLYGVTIGCLLLGISRSRGQNSTT